MSRIGHINDELVSNTEDLLVRSKTVYGHREIRKIKGKIKKKKKKGGVFSPNTTLRRDIMKQRASTFHCFIDSF